MAEGCGAGEGLAVLAEDVGGVCVPARGLVLLTAVPVGPPVAVVWLRDRVLGPALSVVEAAEAVLAAVPWVLAVSCFREVLVAAVVMPVVTIGVLPGPVEDTEGVVVFSSAAVTEGIAGVVAWPAVLGLAVGVVDAVPAPAWAAVCWPGADAAWRCSVVCTVVLWLMGVVWKLTVVLWWGEEWWRKSGGAEVAIRWKDVISGDRSTPRATSAKQEENATKKLKSVV